MAAAVIGAAARSLCFEIKVTFRRLRAHEIIATSPEHRAIVAVAHTPTGVEEQAWIVPARDAKQALNPRRLDLSRALAAGKTPPGWHRP